MGAASFYSFFPVIAKTQKISTDEQKATQIATKMLEHLQLLAPSKLDSTTLTGMLLVDAGQTASPYTFTNCPLDNATDYSPSKALKNGTGTLTISDLAYGSKRIVVSLSWKSPTGKTETFSTGTILGTHRS